MHHYIIAIVPYCHSALATSTPQTIPIVHSALKMTNPTFKASFCSLNARGLNKARKRRQLFRWLHNYKFDVIFLQETYSTPNVELIWKSEWGGDIIHSHGTNHSKGVAILFNPKLDIRIGSSEADKNGR